MNDDRSGYEHGHPTPMAAVLPDIYNKRQWQQQWRLFSLVRDWPTIVGREVGRLTMPAFFRQDTLWIYVQDSAWMHHLQFIKLDLLERINRTLGNQPVSDLRWQLLPQLPSLPERHLPPAHAVDSARTQAFAQMTASIANQECREALQRLWHCFASHDD